MIDHIILTVSDFERSVAFYAKALKPLGITNFTVKKALSGMGLPVYENSNGPYGDKPDSLSGSEPHKNVFCPPEQLDKY